MKSDIIKKPFRFLKNVMRWYQREADNIIKEIRKEIITPELWKKAEENFHRRGMPVPIYENHNEEQVVGSVEDIEAREDGLYVIAHRLFDKGKYLVEREEYPLPSGDFVLHYDEYGNIVNIEIFGVSLVNSEGAKDVEPVTMNKSELDYSVNRVIKADNGLNKNKNKSGGHLMQKEEVLEILNDEDFLKSLPDDIIDKIIAIKESKDKEEDEKEEETSQNKEEDEKEEETSQNKEEDEKEEETSQNKEEDEKEEETSQNKEEDEKEEEASQNKTPEEIQAVIDEVVSAMKNAGASEDDIAKAIDKLNSLKEDASEDKKVSVEAKKANKEEEDESKKSEEASMSKFEDMIALHEAKTGARVVPSSVGQAKKLLRKTRAFMGKKAYKIAFDELSFVGGRSVEKVAMSKNANRKTGDIVKDILSY